MSEHIKIEDGALFFLCPHCSTGIQVLQNQINCKIFRCGVFKHNNQPINPHTPKELCDKFFNDGVIHGCGKPFELIPIAHKEFKVSKCEYK